MNLAGRPRRVGWKVNSLTAGIASVRYRALLPAAALNLAGLRCTVFDNGAERQLDGLDALVIVKSFTPADLRLAQAARERGVVVVLDLCDNVFVDGYAGRRSGLTVAAMFLSIARLAHCVVTPTESLAAVVRQHLPGHRVEVIPDGIEGPVNARAMAAMLRAAQRDEMARASHAFRQRVHGAMRRVRIEGVQVIPHLVGSVARQVRSAIALRMRRSAHVRSTPELAAEVEVHSASSPGTVHILWFGNHGADHGRFGMLDILEFRDALEELARERSIELVVISNHRGKFETHIRPLRVPTRYVEWTPEAVQQWLRVAAAVIVPNTLDQFSVCKSANRTVLALASGVPVVATSTPALAPLAGFVHTEDPLAGLRAILADSSGARVRAEEGFRCAEALFGTEAVQGHWRDLLEDLLRAPAGLMKPSQAQPLIAVLLHLVQDLDLALPVLLQAREAGLECQAWCSAELFAKSPRVLAFLQREKVPFRVLPEGEQALRAFRFSPATRVLLTIAETNLGPHRIPRALTEAALRQGLFTATLQHGFENVGLTYQDALHAIDKITFAAARIYIWGPAATLHSEISESVRSRCLSVGCPKDAVVPAANLGSLIPRGRPIVGIFENLHWHRYSDDYRRGFVESLGHLADSFPDVFFLVKPHHAGGWLSHCYQGERPAASNLLIADPQSTDWEQHTAAGLLPHLAAVITTPSTVALDAARLGLPVAVVAGDLSLDQYAPLPLLADATAWPGFVADVLDPERRATLQSLAGRFVERVLVPGNAARRIVEDLHSAALTRCSA